MISGHIVTLISDLSAVLKIAKSEGFSCDVKALAAKLAIKVSADSWVSLKSPDHPFVWYRLSTRQAPATRRPMKLPCA